MSFDDDKKDMKKAVSPTLIEKTLKKIDLRLNTIVSNSPRGLRGFKTSRSNLGHTNNSAVRDMQLQTSTDLIISTIKDSPVPQYYP